MPWMRARALPWWTCAGPDAERVRLWSRHRGQIGTDRFDARAVIVHLGALLTCCARHKVDW